MKKWETAILSDVCETRTGGTPNRSIPEYWESGTIPWVKSGELRDSWIKADQEKITELGLRKSNCTIFPKDTVVMALYGATAGKLGILNNDAATNQAVCGFFPSSRLFSRFLYYALLSTREALIQQATGGAQPNISQTIVRNLIVPLPPIETQHRIAAELDEQLGAIDEARAAAERRVAAAEALEAALLREHFHGLTPVLIGLPKEAAPAGWKWTRLVELADLESGHTPSRKHPEWWGGDIPWIALPDIRALDGKVAMETKENTNPLGIANSSARILPKDTVALSRTASVGFVTLFGRPMATSQDFVNWVCGKDLSPAFLLHALRASRQHFLANASGAIHKTLYMPAVKDFHLCHPARKTQETLAAALATRLADAATLLTAARAELAAIQALPAAALRRVFA